MIFPHKLRGKGMKLEGLGIRKISSYMKIYTLCKAGMKEQSTLKNVVVATALNTDMAVQIIIRILSTKKGKLHHPLFDDTKDGI